MGDPIVKVIGDGVVARWIVKSLRDQGRSVWWEGGPPHQDAASVNNLGWLHHGAYAAFLAWHELVVYDGKDPTEVLRHHMELESRLSRGEAAWLGAGVTQFEPVSVRVRAARGNVEALRKHRDHPIWSWIRQHLAVDARLPAGPVVEVAARHPEHVHKVSWRSALEDLWPTGTITPSNEELAARGWVVVRTPTPDVPCDHAYADLQVRLLPPGTQPGLDLVWDRERNASYHLELGDADRVEVVVPRHRVAGMKDPGTLHRGCRRLVALGPDAGATFTMVDNELHVRSAFMTIAPVIAAEAIEMSAALPVHTTEGMRRLEVGTSVPGSERGHSIGSLPNATSALFTATDEDPNR